MDDAKHEAETDSEDESEHESEWLRLYHYTGRQSGLKALWEKRLKVTRYTELNDPFELAPFELKSKKSRQFWDEQLARVLGSGHGMLCFSETWRSTLMWSQYGRKHTGLCLGFDVKRRSARPISYVDRPLDDPARRKREFRKMSEDALAATLLHKHSGWRHEKEWRVRVSLSAQTDGLCYRKFDDDLHLREVIIGPSCPLRTADIVEAVIHPPLDVDIFKATAATGAFEICKHELFDTHTARGFRAALALARDAYAHELPDEAEG